MLVDDFIFTPDDFAVKEKKKHREKKWVIVLLMIFFRISVNRM